MIWRCKKCYIMRNSEFRILSLLEEDWRRIFLWHHTIKELKMLSINVFFQSRPNTQWWLDDGAKKPRGTNKTNWKSMFKKLFCLKYTAFYCFLLFASNLTESVSISIRIILIYCHWIPLHPTETSFTAENQASHNISGTKQLLTINYAQDLKYLYCPVFFLLLYGNDVFQ